MAPPTTKKSPTQATSNSGSRPIKPFSTTGSHYQANSSTSTTPISCTSTGGSASPPLSPRSNNSSRITMIVPQSGTSSLFLPTNKSRCPPTSQPSTSNVESSTPFVSFPGKRTPPSRSTPGATPSTTTTVPPNRSFINSSTPSPRTAIFCSMSALNPTAPSPKKHVLFCSRWELGCASTEKPSTVHGPSPYLAKAPPKPLKIQRRRTRTFRYTLRRTFAIPPQNLARSCTLQRLVGRAGAPSH